MVKYRKCLKRENNMKRKFFLFVCLVLGGLTACGNNDSRATTEFDVSESTTESENIAEYSKHNVYARYDDSILDCEEDSIVKFKNKDGYVSILDIDLDDFKGMIATDDKNEMLKLFFLDIILGDEKGEEGQYCNLYEGSDGMYIFKYQDPNEVQADIEAKLYDADGYTAIMSVKLIRKLTLGSKSVQQAEDIERALNDCFESVEVHYDLDSQGVDRMVETLNERAKQNIEKKNKKIQEAKKKKKLEEERKKAEKIESKKNKEKSEEEQDEMEETRDIYSLEYGELLDVNKKGGADFKTLVIKAKIKPNLTNKLTIQQNFHNIEDIVKNKDGDKYNAIDYWAVADMTDGSEGKVISFTVSKEMIQDIINDRIFVTQYKDYVDDLWILPSLQE